MAKRTKIQIYTNEDFEAKAQELLHIALTMSEEQRGAHLRGPEAESAHRGYSG